MILICGLPNAGKTTYSKRYENVLHLDDFPTSKFLNCNKAVSEADEDVVVEGIYNSIVRRKKLLESCKHMQRKVCIWLNTPKEVCVSREDRGRPSDMIYSHLMQQPTVDEGWDEVIIVNGV